MPVSILMLLSFLGSKYIHQDPLRKSLNCKIGDVRAKTPFKWSHCVFPYVYCLLFASTLAVSHFKNDND